MILLWIIIAVESIAILFLLLRPPQVKIIEKDVGKEYQLQYEKEKNEKLSKLDRHVSEEKEKSITKIHKNETEMFHAIEEQREKEEWKLKNKFLELQKEESQKFEDFKKQQEELKLAKQKELEGKINESFEKLDKVQEESVTGIEEIKISIEEWKSKYKAAIEAYKQLDKERQAEDFYRIEFSETEGEELTELNKVIRKLKNPMPFYKAIYQIYYRNKISDLTKRVVGTGKVSGIYKITNMDNGKCYVGQSVDISNRWKQHVKRGVGADAVTKNKLYPILMEEGIQNFTFEIVEETDDTSKLNEMEQYWQEFLGAKEFGYSQK